MSAAVRQVHHFRKYQRSESSHWRLLAVGVLFGFDLWLVSYLVMQVYRMVAR